jgi:hypothetical protein
MYYEDETRMTNGYLLFIFNFQEKPKEVPITRIMKLNSSEIGYIIIGCIAAIAQGGVQPVFAIVFSSIIGVSSIGYKCFKTTSLCFT